MAEVIVVDEDGSTLLDASPLQLASVLAWKTAEFGARQSAKVLKGEEVPNPWVLPQPKITQENLDQYVKPDMPPLYYALCGCEDLPNFPKGWQ